MSRKRTIVSTFLISELRPFDFFLNFPKNSCTPHISVTLWDIFMKLNRNVYQVKTTCRVQFWLFSWFNSYGPLIVFLYLFCVIFTHVHFLTISPFMISSCNFMGIYNI